MYQAATRSARPPVDTVRVVLVLDVPAASAELRSRTAQLANEFGRLIAHSVPGVRARKAVVSTGALTTGPVRSPHGLTIDRVNREVRIDGHPVRLDVPRVRAAVLPGGATSAAGVACGAHPRGVARPPPACGRVVPHRGHPCAKASRQVGPVRQGAHHDPGPRLPIRSRSGRALHGRRVSGLSAYSVAVYGPAGWQIDLGGFPVEAHPLPEEVYVAPGR